jgi:diguanylate cyclase (GGDEF)-like protein/PAS domain S-box-containing protein
LLSTLSDRTFIDTLIEKLIIIDGSGQVLLINTAAESFFDHSQNTVVGESIQTLFPEFDLSLLHAGQAVTTLNLTPHVCQALDLNSRLAQDDRTCLLIKLTSPQAPKHSAEQLFIVLVQDTAHPWQQAMVFQALNQELEALVHQRTAKLQQLDHDLQQAIHERMEVDIELQESELRYRAIVEDQTELICRFDAMGTLNFVNEAYCRFFDQNQSDLIGKNYLEVCLDSLNFSRQLNFFSSLTPDNTLEVLEHQVQGSHGQKYWLQWTNRVILDGDHQIIGYQSVGRDITQQKEAELALSEQTQHYQAIVEMAADGIWLIDTDYRTSFVNQRMADMLGYEVEAVLGRSIFEFMDEEGTAIARQKFQESRSDRAEQYDLRLQCRDGSILWVIISTTPTYDTSDHYVGAVSMMTDITERKKAEAILQDNEERFRAIFEQAGVGMVIFTLEGHFFRVNQTLCDLLGYNRIELLTQRYEDLLHLNDRLEANRLHQRLYEGLESSYRRHQYYQCRDGHWLWGATTVSLVRDGDNTPKYFVGVIEDMSAQQAALQEREAAEESLRALLNAIQEGAFLLDAGGMVLQANQAIARRLNVPLEAFVQSHFTTSFPPDWINLYSTHIDQVLRSGEPSLFVHETQDSYFDNVIYPICDRENTVTRLAVFSLDLTDEKRTEVQLREQQHFIEKIANSSPNILYVYDLIENCNVYSNNQIGAVLGYSLEDLAVMGSHFLSTIIHPDDLDRYAQHVAAFDDVDDGAVLEFEYRAHHANGSWHWLSSHDTLFRRTSDGRPHQIIGTATDITERKNAENAIKQVNAQLTDQLAELELRHQEMVLLGKMNSFLQVCRSMTEAYDVIADLLQPLFPHCGGALFRFNASEKSLTQVTSWGEQHTSQSQFPAQHCWALRRSQPHWAMDDSSALFCSHVHPSHRASHETLCLPMLAQGEILGLLYLNNDQSGAFNDAKQQLARTVAEHLSLALASLELRETLKTQSIHDPLMGLYNRRYMEESLHQELQKAKQHQQCLTVVMLDVDHFKQFNDTFGHEAGDVVLQELGQVLQQSLRDSDVPCRYGGEEMVLILPDLGGAIAYERMEMIRHRVKELQVKAQGQPLDGITISIGIAEFPKHGTTEVELMQAADAALYEAKKGGRDRTIVATVKPAMIGS